MKKGFTIVEVLVVIGIIAILTVIIFPSISNIRAKNRDAERVADISAIQLGLSLFYSQSTTTTGYPNSLSSLSPKYFPADSLVGPNNNEGYTYVPLKRQGSNKCTYYHLGTILELSSGQIDTADNFNSNLTIPGDTSSEIISRGYYWCNYSGPGIATGTNNYNVHP